MQHSKHVSRPHRKLRSSPRRLRPFHAAEEAVVKEHTRQVAATVHCPKGKRWRNLSDDESRAHASSGVRVIEDRLRQIGAAWLFEMGSTSEQLTGEQRDSLRQNLAARIVAAPMIGDVDVGGVFDHGV
jgi:hypothetical protein